MKFTKVTIERDGEAIPWNQIVLTCITSGHEVEQGSWVYEIESPDGLIRARPVLGSGETDGRRSWSRLEVFEIAGKPATGELLYAME